jgi:hypothetical protein
VAKGSFPDALKRRINHTVAESKKLKNFVLLALIVIDLVLALILYHASFSYEILRL